MSRIAAKDRMLSRVLYGILVLLLVGCHPEEKSKVLDLSLDGAWSFKKAGTSQWLPAQVPGNVVSDLYHNKKIPDPYFRDNLKLCQWIEKADWVYQTKFNLPQNILKQDVVELRLDGLDTYADVILNDSLILRANNMFRSWTVNCKRLLKARGNMMEIRFHSPVLEGLLKKRKLSYNLFIEDEEAPKGSKTSVFTRKAAYQYGWDGGPRLVSSGIWRPVHIMAWSGARIESIWFKPIQLSSKLAIYNTEVVIESSSDQRMRLELMVNRKNVIGATDVKLKKGKNIKSLSFTINDPKLWWPNGLGKPYLYNLTVLLKKHQSIVDLCRKDLGIRQIELIQKADSDGTGFWFKVNNIPVYMKGANYVPSEELTGDENPGKLSQLVAYVRDANMNMIRVWGGGVYESKKFYDLCDQNGILVWQDFMFSASMQPADSMHLANIRAEALENVKRLRNHPCIALWCGNSEIRENWKELSWSDNYKPAIAKQLTFNYDTIFNHILPQVVTKFDAGTPYVASTPMGREHSDGTYSGDQHDWGVWYNDASFDAYDYDIGRFVSEFGMQSYPDVSSIRQFTLPSDRTLHSPILRAHQWSAITQDSSAIQGNDLIYNYCMDYYRKTQNFDTLVYISQVMQSQALKRAIDDQRISRPHCMGSLFWQLNDSWPAVSWSVIDYYNQLKLSYYTVANEFAPIIVVPVQEKNNVNIYGVNDLPKITDAILLARLIDFHGKTLYVKQIPVKIAPNSSSILCTVDHLSDIKDYNPKTCCLVVQLNQPNSTLAQNVLCFVRPRSLILPRAKINVNINEAVRGYTIALKSDVLVKNLGLFMNSGKGRFSDNNFDLLPDKRTKISVTYKGTRKELLNDLEIFSLNNY